MIDAMIDEQWEDVTELVGFGAAAAYLGIKRNTLTSYCSRGNGPSAQSERRVVKGWALPVFERAELDRWRAARPGQGARTDLAQQAAPE